MYKRQLYRFVSSRCVAIWYWQRRPTLLLFIGLWAISTMLFQVEIVVLYMWPSRLVVGSSSCTVCFPRSHMRLPYDHWWGLILYTLLLFCILCFLFGSLGIIDLFKIYYFSCPYCILVLCFWSCYSRLVIQGSGQPVGGGIRYFGLYKCCLLYTSRCV